MKRLGRALRRLFRWSNGDCGCPRCVKRRRDAWPLPLDFMEW